ncbi:laccase, multicopper oxidase, benzenediol:oxygen oxidorectuctase [Ceratobasidium sp. 394]|nr:laccase, multicopper oxidase, benzenediol:oxygen oxidorectuctase [Ceratobasidium sp. 394]
MIVSRRAILCVLLPLVTGIFAYDGYSPSLPLVQSRLEELTLSPDFEITDKPTTRSYNWVVEMKEGAPDGFYRQMLVVNGQYPGPTIEANEGDTIVVNVQNKMPKVGTSIHWHGIFQNGTAWMDGPAGITQCPIPAGGSFKYNFKIQGQFGTYWWHAHAGGQLSDGIHGALIVHSVRDPLRRGVQYDYDQILIMPDWYHNTSAEIIAALETPQGYQGSHAAPPPISAMFNGYGTWDCSKYGTPKTCFTQKPFELAVVPNKTYRLRIINPATHAMIWNSVDGHTLDVIEADDTAISSPAVNNLHRVKSHNGQRYSVILKTDKGKPGDAFWMRGEMNSGCFAYTTKDFANTSLAVLRYVSPGYEPTKNMPTTKDWTEVLGTSCRDIDTSALVPLVKEDAPTVVAQHGMFANQVGAKPDGVGEFTLNNVSIDHLWYRPVLYDVVSGKGVDNTRISSLTFDGRPGDGADIIINNLDPIDHPYHLHAMTFWIVAEGSGTLTEDAYMQVKFNTTNPLRRDTHVVPARTWAVLRVRPNIPGVWFLHCHIDWHLAAGFAAVIVVQPEAVRKFQIPAKSSDLCKHRPPGQGINSTSLGRREAGSGMRRRREHPHEKRFSHDLNTAYSQGLVY